MSETVLELHGITKIFPGVKALDQVEFNLKKGEIHALMGENGIFIAEVLAWLGADLILVPSYFLMLKRVSQ